MCELNIGICELNLSGSYLTIGKIGINILKLLTELYLLLIGDDPVPDLLNTIPGSRQQ